MTDARVINLPSANGGLAFNNMDNVFISEDGEYLTIPDGDKAKLKDILDFIIIKELQEKYSHTVQEASP